uniref:Uncharacterized protein n=1 Tax=Ditylenchus dipsaci TaxID=166011 RepID=A0A915E6Y0_9BILA
MGLILELRSAVNLTRCWLNMGLYERCFKVITDGASNMANAFRDVCSVEVMIQYLEDYNEEETEKTDEVSSDCRKFVLSIEQDNFPFYLRLPLRVKLCS